MSDRIALECINRHNLYFKSGDSFQPSNCLGRVSILDCDTSCCTAKNEETDSRRNLVYI